MPAFEKYNAQSNKNLQSLRRSMTFDEGDEFFLYEPVVSGHRFGKRKLTIENENDDTNESLPSTPLYAGQYLDSTNKSIARMGHFAPARFSNHKRTRFIQYIEAEAPNGNVSRLDDECDQYYNDDEVSIKSNTSSTNHNRVQASSIFRFKHQNEISSPLPSHVLPIDNQFNIATPSTFLFCAHPANSIPASTPSTPETSSPRWPSNENEESYELDRILSSQEFELQQKDRESEIPLLFLTESVLLPTLSSFSRTDNDSESDSAPYQPCIRMKLRPLYDVLPNFISES